jgi:hypothetical protein
MMLRKLVVFLLFTLALASHAAELKPVKPAPLQLAPACALGASRCEGNQFQQCSGGKWITSQTCGAAQSCDPKRGCVGLTRQAPQLKSRVPLKPTTPPLTRQAPAVTAPPLVRTPAQMGGHLTCPTVPTNPVVLPPPPYDEARGDCALRGKSAQIEAWLSSLESIAASCQARRAGYWTDTINSYNNLGNQIDNLPLAPEEASLYMRPVCPTYPGSGPGSSRSASPLSRDGWHYTDWLKRIGENVQTYCDLVDRLIEPMYQACDEINFYLGCELTTDAIKSSWHGLLNGKRNAAQIRYDYTHFYYSNTLQTYGWGNFRAYFNENYIHCEMERPPIQMQAPPGMMTPPAE